MDDVKIDQTQESPLAARLGLPAKFTIIYDAESDRVYQQLQSGRRFALAAHEYLIQNLFWYWSFALGAYAAFAGGMHLIGCIILIHWGMMVRHHWLLGSVNFRPGVNGREPLEIQVTVHEEGIIEADRGVESRFAWAAMNQWYLWHSILFIQLKNGRYAILPQRGLQPSTIKVEALSSLLKIKGVPGMRLKDSDAFSAISIPMA